MGYAVVVGGVGVERGVCEEVGVDVGGVWGYGEGDESVEGEEGGGGVGIGDLRALGVLGCSDRVVGF